MANIVSGAGNDNINLYGQTGSNTVDGGDGDDEISSGIGDDTLIGGAGNDFLYGDQGNNILYILMRLNDLISFGFAGSSYGWSYKCLR